MRRLLLAASLVSALAACSVASAPPAHRDSAAVRKDVVGDSTCRAGYMITSGDKCQPQ